MRAFRHVTIIVLLAVTLLTIALLSVTLLTIIALLAVTLLTITLLSVALLTITLIVRVVWLLLWLLRRILTACGESGCYFRNETCRLPFIHSGSPYHRVAVYSFYQFV